jgi:eukaryotic-like serine/threonine-protein kinase
MATATRSGDPASGTRGRASEALVLDRLRARLLGRTPAATRVGRYVLGERLGAGGMGVVYRARDPNLDRDVAIKLVHGGRDRDRLQREARALARLSHPNVVAVFDVGAAGVDEIFIAMELVEGRTLRQCLQGPELGFEQVMRWMIAAGRGLAAAHRVGLVHRDVKPENVMVGDDARVRVADFGLSRAPSLAPSVPSGGASSDDLATLTRTRGVVGTPHYMAPEQHRGDAVDARTDVYGFCVVLYEAVCGVRPFSATTAEGLSAAKSRPLGALRHSAVPAWLWRVIARGLHPEPDRRWPTMDALLEALLDRSRRRRLGLTGGACIATALAVAVAPSITTRAASSSAPTSSFGGLAERGAMLSGVVALQDGDYPASAERFERAFHGAVRRGDDAGARLAAARLALVSVQGLRRLDDARRWIRHAHVDDAALDGAEVAQITRRAEAKLALATGDTRGAIERFTGLHRDADQGGDPIAIATALCDLGDAYARGGDFERALSTRTQALAVIEASGRTREPVHARAWAGRGRALDELARPAEARVAFERALALRTATQRPEHPEIAASLLDLGVAKIGAGEFGPGQRDLAHALEIYEHSLGPEHPELGVVHAAIGNGASDARDYDLARVHHERAIAIFTAAFGPDDPKLGAELLNLGLVRYEQGDDLAALQVFVEGLRVLEAALGPDHPHVAAAAHSVGQTAARLHRPAQALGYLARAAEIRTRRFGEAHPLTAQTRASRAAALRDLGLYEAAVVEFESAVETMAAAAGAEDSLAHARWGLALALVDAGRGGKRARALARQALAFHRERGGAADPNAIEIRDWLAARD